MQDRFERIEADPLGTKVRSRAGSPPGLTGRSDAHGDFLARLWTLFGPPNERPPHPEHPR